VSNLPKEIHPLAYLDRIMGHYPAGVAVASIIRPQVAEQVVASGEQLARCLVFVVCDGEEGLAESETAMLEAICVKGLRLAMSQCVVRHVPKGSAVEGLLEREIKDLTPAVALVFGSGAFEATPMGATAILRTYSLGELAQSAERKKQLWKEIQANVLPVIARV
jgi:hypothetical protein